MWVREYKWLCYFMSRIDWVNKTIKKEIIKSVFDSVNHTRFPKEDRLPDCASRDNQFKKGDLVDLYLVLFISDKKYGNCE